MLKNVFIDLIGAYSSAEEYNLKCWEEVERKYTSKGRYYHNLNHLERMLYAFQKVEYQVSKPDAVLFAIFYHDIVYRPGRSNNENKSALLFQKRVSRTQFSYIREVMEHIRATKTHVTTSNFDTNLMLDLDLLTLGTERKEYLEYCHNIKKEYGFLPERIYKNRRRKALKKFLDFSTIYKTPYFFQTYESQARENLSHALKSL